MRLAWLGLAAVGPLLLVGVFLLLGESRAGGAVLAIMGTGIVALIGPVSFLGLWWFEDGVRNTPTQQPGHVLEIARWRIAWRPAD